MPQDSANNLYEVLGVSPKATATEINKAYREKAMQFHPDRNKNTDTTAIFQQINSAYRILGDPIKRAEYDSQLDEQEYAPSETADGPTEISPLVCSKCGNISAQLRYAIFFRVASFLYASSKTPIQGLFCPSCALKVAIKCDLFSWFLGWWGIPMGPIWTIQSLFINSFGGKQLPQVNAKVMAHQSLYFAQRGYIDLARAIAWEGIQLTKRIKSNTISQSEEQSLISTLTSILQLKNKDAPIRKLKKHWGISSRLGTTQVLINGACAFLLFGSIAVFAYFQNTTDQVAIPTQTAAIPHPHHTEFAGIPLILPRTGVFHSYFRKSDSRTLAPLKISTSGNNINYFIKVVRSDTERVVETIFIRGGDTAITHIPLGSYRIKYADGRIWYGTKLLFGPSTQYIEANQLFKFDIEGDKVAGFSLELWKQINGNMETRTIPRSAF